MKKAADLLRNSWKYIVGAIFGAIAGYLYWYYIGCASGTCPITSSPIASSVWGGVFGSLLFSIFRKNSKE